MSDIKKGTPTREDLPGRNRTGQEEKRPAQNPQRQEKVPEGMKEVAPGVYKSQQNFSVFK